MNYEGLEEAAKRKHSAQSSLLKACLPHYDTMRISSLPVQLLRQIESTLGIASAPVMTNATDALRNKSEEEMISPFSETMPVSNNRL